MWVVAGLVVLALIAWTSSAPPPAPAAGGAPGSLQLPGGHNEYDNQIIYACNQVGLADPLWYLTVKAIIGQESGWVPTKVGDDGVSIGLMQVNTRVHAYDVPYLLDPNNNILAGTQILARCASDWGYALGPTLRCYNGCVAYLGGPTVGCTDPDVWTGYSDAVRARLAPLAAQAGITLPAV